MLLHYLVKRETGKNAFFSLKCCITALPEFNQLLDFFNLFDSRLILTLLYDSLNLGISVVRYPRYLGKYRDTTCDDTSIAKVTVNRGPTIP